MRRKQKQIEKKKRLEEELKAKKEAEEIARLEAEAREQEKKAANRKRLLEQQESERLHKRYVERKKKIDKQEWDMRLDALLSEIKQRSQQNKKLEEIRIIIKKREPTLQVLDWESWLSIPLNRELAELDIERAIEMFKRDNFLAKRRKKTRGKPTAINYGLSFTGNDAASARADLVATQFTPNDPTNKGFAEDSGRKPLGESGFTISYWVRPDEMYNDSFHIGWKENNNARFEFGFKNVGKPWFGVGANTLNSPLWYTLFVNSGNADLVEHLDSDAELILGEWYHIVVSYVGTDGPNNERYRRVYFNGKQIRGYNSEAIGTDYNDYFNVDNVGDINWDRTSGTMTQGLSFGMRATIASGTHTDGLRNTKYNNGNACGLDEVAIYNEVKDNDWIRNVYNSATSYNHKTSGGDGLVAYWRFNEGIGTTVKDLGPYGWHGTLTNATHGTAIDTGINSLPPSGTPTWIKIPKGYG